MQHTEKRIVKVGLGQLEKKMTKEQAKRYGNKNIPLDVKKAGFETVIFVSDAEINGNTFYRINYGKKC
ncbi:MAG: hypothetical protein M0R77_07780 [Gammaproteobacteria bacterium]|nr:hypothetical protein [Gammaproteobacteria bacterium]